MKLNTLYNDFCEDGLKRLEPNMVNMVFTSPPYAEQRNNVYNGINEHEYIDWFIPIANDINSALNEHGSFFLNIKEHVNNGSRSLYVLELVKQICEQANFKLIDTFCWTKNGFPGKIKNRFKNGWEPIYHFAKSTDIAIFPDQVAQPIKDSSKRRLKSEEGIRMSQNGSMLARPHSENMRGRTTAYPSNHLNIHNVINQYSVNKWHPATFPIELVTFFIRAFTKKGDLVVDPFAGSGTTLRAAIREERNYIGFESKLKYFLKTQKILNEENNIVFKTAA